MASTPPRPKSPPRSVLSRVAMSSFLREAEHGIFYAERCSPTGRRTGRGAERRRSDRGRQLEGPPALAHRQARLSVPETRSSIAAMTCPRRLGRCAGRCWSRPISAAPAPGIVRYSSQAELAASIADGSVPRERRQGAARPGLCPCPRRHDRPGRDARRQSSTRSRSKAAATASTCARPTPAWPSPDARPYG